jgi:hypothetical protein
MLLSVLLLGHSHRLSPLSATRTAPLAPASSPRITSLRMAVTFEQASGLWGLQRNRNADSVELIAKEPGWRLAEVRTLVPRNGPGLGIALEELGSDGQSGLVIVESVVAGSNAASASNPILPGDAIVAVGPASESITVEGLTYDQTVAVLGSLDPTRPIELTLRRLERLPRVSVTLQFPQEGGRADEMLELLPGMPLRRSILSRGIKLNDPLARRFDAGWGTGDCGGEGTCCTCALEVTKGIQALSVQASQERQMLAKHPTWRLACKASIAELKEDCELVLRVAPRQAAKSGEADFMDGERPS